MANLSTLLMYGVGGYVLYSILTNNSSLASSSNSSSPSSASSTSNNAYIPGGGNPGGFSASSDSSSGANALNVPQSTATLPSWNSQQSGGFASNPLFSTPAPAPRAPTPTYSSYQQSTMPAPSDPVGGMSMADYQKQLQFIADASAKSSAQLQQQVDTAQANYAQQHATAEYCGPGCYVWKDANGNVTGQTGTPGSSASSLLNQVAGGVSGLSFFAGQ